MIASIKFVNLDINVEIVFFHLVHCAYAMESFYFYISVSVLGTDNQG